MYAILMHDLNHILSSQYLINNQVPSHKKCWQEIVKAKQSKYTSEVQQNSEDNASLIVAEHLYAMFLS